MRKISNNIVLSICTITYNHQNYISQALESFLMQNTNFNFEIFIGDDSSTDNTLEICKKYALKYPGKIKILTSQENLGAIPNLIRTLKACNGKYIAWCEGDDYWTDPLKLQKQVDFLEKNPGYSLCFHDALILWDDKSRTPRYFCPEDQKETSTIGDIINDWFIPSASIVFRNELITSFPYWFKEIYNGDYALLLLLADKGKIKYFNEVMSVYRKSENALSAGIGKNHIYIIDKIIQLLTFFNEYSELRYDDIINNKIIKLYRMKKYLLIRKKFPLYKYLNTDIWIRKTINVLNNILNSSDRL